jgi:hypothetical protein
MTNHLFSGCARTAVAIAAVSVLAAGCNRTQEAQPPAAQTQTQTPVQTLNTPESVTGCLRAGEAPDTFVLTTSQTEDGRPPITYEVVGAAGVNIKEHVGERVAINGVVREQQSTTTASATAPATDKPQGTSGTPNVQTTATLQMRRIDVSAINRAAGDCEK